MDKQSLREILIAGTDDWLYLDEVPSLLGLYNDNSSREVIFETTISTVNYLLAHELFEVGDVLEGIGFRCWDTSNDQAMNRIRTDWLKLDRPLYPGDVCWLSITKKGEQLVEELDS